MLSQGYAYYYRRVMITLEDGCYCSHLYLDDEHMVLKKSSLYTLIKQLDKTLEHDIAPEDSHKLSRREYLQTVIS
ncbi:hypothetical protein [Vibrio sonorensis]|uniref:hypothetical protein n=1 Tax=Vibrio sonorensis TaxID=1004316 RepID=UPI00111460B5|nr:hypothetical protein [Vibrio sonorensis]